jgi:hypothetical protein
MRDDAGTRRRAGQSHGQTRSNALVIVTAGLTGAKEYRHHKPRRRTTFWRPGALMSKRQTGEK